MNGVILWYSIFYAPFLYYTISRDSYELSWLMEPITEKPVYTVYVIKNIYILKTII